MEAELESSENDGEVTGPAQNQNGRTAKVIFDIKAFEGMRTPYHQLRYPPNIRFPKPQQFEFSKVKAVW